MPPQARLLRLAPLEKIHPRKEVHSHEKISIRDLDLLTIGMVNDMYAESSNDGADYSVIAGQDNFDSF